MTRSPLHVPRSNEEQGGNEEGSGDTSTLLFAGGIVALLLIAVLGVTMMFMRGRRGSDQQDSVESFGGVEQMDPVEAYVQQLVAQAMMSKWPDSTPRNTMRSTTRSRTRAAVADQSSGTRTPLPW